MMLVFGPFTLDVERRIVRNNGTALRLTLKCRELLAALARNSGKVLTKQALLEAAWPDGVGSDATLAQHVFLLRRALGDGAQWIRTIPNVGYCFDADVCVIEASADERSHALETYLEGARGMREIGTERALRSAIDICSHAIALDDAAATPYALRASCWRLLAESMYAEPLPCLESAKADADAAIARASTSADAHIEAAFCCAVLERNHALAQRHLVAAHRLAPQHPLLAHMRIWIALMNGRRDEALHLSRDDGGPLYAAALYMAGDPSRARAILDGRTVADHGSRVIRGACALLEGDHSAALEEFHDVYHADAYAEGACGTPSVRHYALALYIYTLGKMGRIQAAREQMRELEAISLRRYVSPMVRAVAHLAVGEREHAIVLVHQALRRFDPWSAYVAIDPMLHELRELPEFSDVMRSAA